MGSAPATFPPHWSCFARWTGRGFYDTATRSWTDGTKLSVWTVEYSDHPLHDNKYVVLVEVKISDLLGPKFDIHQMVSLEIYSGSEQFKFTPYFSHFPRSNPVISY